MHETPKGADIQQQDRDGQQALNRQQNKQGGGNAGGQGAGATGTQADEESGAGYGNNAGPQGDR